ncbi:MAG: creatininase family protein [Dehalococcoidia bacterium]
MQQNAYVLGEMTWPETAEALKTVRVAIIPTGSNEQHGPHLALRTDIANAASMALRVAQRLGPKAVVVPSLPFGVSPHHMAFPGTVTLRPETFLAVLRDIITSLSDHGVKHFFVMNGHGGNNPSLGQLMLTIKRDLGVDAAFAQLWPSREVLRRYAATSTFGHSCDLEVSWSLYLSPEVVRKDKLTKGTPKAARYRHAGTLVTVAAGFDERTENGALGDATQATYEKGESLITPMIDVFVEFLEDFVGKDGS